MLSYLIWMITIVFPFLLVDGYKVACNDTSTCQLVRQNSTCLSTGFCSNPYHNRGCLANAQFLKNSTNGSSSLKYFADAYTRVCSSSDGNTQAQKAGYCKPVGVWNYTEIRFMGNNWESVFFSTWIAQIVLSEILGVPTSVDTGSDDVVVDFYDVEGRMEYGKGYDWKGMRKAQEIGDCRNIIQPANKSEYISCSHASLEVWAGAEEGTKLLEFDNITEKKSPMGVVATSGFYIPRFTAEKDPTVVTYFGLVGDRNRQKLADLFLRPTKWIDYCTQVSTSNCTIPDNVTSRAPATTKEETKMFMAGEYTGYFRKTNESNCVMNPDTCTGHFVDYPCGWSSYAKQQFHHLGIALTSSGDEPYCGGYTYSQMLEIWAAANATESNVMMKWWEPEASVYTYFGSRAEFQKISLPIPTQECLDNRIDPMQRCEPGADSIGTKLGSCDDITEPLMKVVTRNLYDVCHDSSVPVALHSPAYDSIKSFQVSRFQLGSMFQNWIDKQDQQDPRDQVCEWVSENLELVLSYIPRSYPRVMEHGDTYSKQPLFYISLILAVLVMVLVLAVMVQVYKKRKNRAIIIAQVEFLFLLLSGLTLVQIGSIALAVQPSDISCAFSMWMINVGYTIELVPLIVKVAAVNRLMAAGRQLKRLQIERLHLFMLVACVTLCMLVYLAVWAVTDPLLQDEKYDLTNSVTPAGQTIVSYYKCCRSRSQFWSIVANIWRSILLLSATVLAFQTRKNPVNFNEFKPLGIMIYSQFSFLVWSLVIFFVQDALVSSQVQRYFSLIHSADVAIVCFIYFIPKLRMSDEMFTEQSHRTTTEGRIIGSEHGDERHPRMMNKHHIKSSNGAIASCDTSNFNPKERVNSSLISSSSSTEPGVGVRPTDRSSRDDDDVKKKDVEDNCESAPKPIFNSAKKSRTDNATSKTRLGFLELIVQVEEENSNDSSLVELSI